MRGLHAWRAAPPPTNRNRGHNGLPGTLAGPPDASVEVLRNGDSEAAVAAANAICSAVENLSAHPLPGRRIHGDIREPVISYSATGYIALYRCLVPQDQIRVLAIRRQREIRFVP
jgi:plasmid stabilization system protein ParE